MRVYIGSLSHHAPDPKPDYIVISDTEVDPPLSTFIPKTEDLKPDELIPSCNFKPEASNGGRKPVDPNAGYNWVGFHDGSFDAFCRDLDMAWRAEAMDFDHDGRPLYAFEGDDNVLISDIYTSQ